MCHLSELKFSHWEWHLTCGGNFQLNEIIHSECSDAPTMRSCWDVLFSAGTQANETTGPVLRELTAPQTRWTQGQGIPLRSSTQCGLQLWCVTTLERALNLESGDRGGSDLGSTTYCVTWDRHHPSGASYLQWVSGSQPHRMF